MVHDHNNASIHLYACSYFYVGTYMYIIYCILPQTLSESVSNALYLTGGSKAFETAYFVGKVDKLFDCLNVSFYNQGKLKWKPFQQPYRSPNDFRLKVHTTLHIFIL